MYCLQQQQQRDERVVKVETRNNSSPHISWRQMFLVATEYLCVQILSADLNTHTFCIYDRMCAIDSDKPKIGIGRVGCMMKL